MAEKYKCEPCGLEFETKEEFEKHLREHHGHEHHH